MPPGQITPCRGFLKHRHRLTVRAKFLEVLCPILTFPVMLLLLVLAVLTIRGGQAVVSGIYITEIKSVRGGRVEAPQQKKSLRVRLSEKLLRKSKELNASAAEDSKGKKKKK